MTFATINKGSSYFNTVLYTGNGSTQSITGVGFQPDWVWMKDRTVGFDHVLQDSVRGTTNIINSNQDYAEFANANSITSFNSDGFTTGSYVATNNSTTPFVSWNWLGANTTVSNTQGSITSTVSANTTSGFSIVSYTGTTGVATVGHGLGVAPSLIIVKNRSVVSSWVVYHKSLGATKYLFLNLNLAQQTDSLAWNNTEPDSSKFTINNYTNGSGNNLIAYCFAEVKGYSKFSSYTGNGSTDGTFIYTGFKPAYVLVKNTITAGNVWAVFDNKRLGYNVSNLALFPSDSSAETSGTSYIDILSNGFKMRSLNDFNNKSGDTYIYAAFAENPFVLTDGTPVTAR